MPLRERLGVPRAEEKAADADDFSFPGPPGVWAATGSDTTTNAASSSTRFIDSS